MKDPRVGVGVAAVLIDDESRILVMKRSPTVSHGRDVWSLPGGWIDFGETPEEAMVRECKEEIGVDVTITLFRGYTSDTHPDDELHVVCMFFQCDWEGEPRIMEPDKATDLTWLNPYDLAERNTFKPLSSFLEKYLFISAAHRDD